MGSLDQAARNEKVKLRANSVNAVSLLFIGTGGVTPLVAFSFGLNPGGSFAWLLAVLVWVCVGIFGHRLADGMLDEVKS